MLVSEKDYKKSNSLNTLIDQLELYSDDFSFGKDVDDLHHKFFIEKENIERSMEEFLKWVGRYQPCLFGRLGAKKVKGVEYDICWLTTDDIKLGDIWLIEKIQKARRVWKDRAAQGLASGFLIMFQDEKLARAKPSDLLLDVCQKASELFIIENYPLKRDTIYTEAVPLIQNGNYGVFKGGINVFYTGAHRTLNHDRRLPGGILISVNSPGHLANSLVKRGEFSSLTEAVNWVYDLAMKSIGNGGINHPNAVTNSWHNITTDEEVLNNRCPLKHRPNYIPSNYDGRTYSASYHTDVLLPTAVTVSDKLDENPIEHEVWQWLVIDYISEAIVNQNDVNHGLFHARPILPEAKYHNPWPPIKAKNSSSFEY